MKNNMHKPYTIKNNICLFYKGELSQWWGFHDSHIDGNMYINIDFFFRFISNYSKHNLDKFEQTYTITDIHQPKRIFFNCAEQAHMFGKAVIFGDIAVAEDILTRNHPSDQLYLGRQVKGFCQEYWDEIKIDFLTGINYQKFHQNIRLRNILTKTYKNYILAEASNDLIYGCGFNEKQEESGFVEKWTGQNLLGDVLMRVRNKLNDNRYYYE